LITTNLTENMTWQLPCTQKSGQSQVKLNSKIRAGKGRRGGSLTNKLKIDQKKKLSTRTIFAHRIVTSKNEVCRAFLTALFSKRIVC
jgi:hypothetical protein